MKKWIPIITILLMIGLFAFLLKSYAEDAEQSRLYQEWDYMRQPYSERLDRLNRQLTELEKEYQSAQTPKAVAQILFTEADAKVYTEGFPFLDEYGYTATLALSLTELPGLDGCMTTEQFTELMNAGWSTCLRYDGENVSSWWQSLVQELSVREIQIPEAVYFPQGTYQVSMDKELEKLGFKIVITKVADDASPLVLEKGEGIWHISAMGFMREDAKVRLDEAAEQQANIVYCVGFETQDEIFRTDAFSPMLECFDTHRAGGSLIVLNADEARENFHAGQTEHNPKFQKRYEIKKERIEAKILEVKEQLQELDSKYKNRQ